MAKTKFLLMMAISPQTIKILGVMKEKREVIFLNTIIKCKYIYINLEPFLV